MGPVTRLMNLVCSNASSRYVEHLHFWGFLLIVWKSMYVSLPNFSSDFYNNISLLYY